MPLKDKVYWYGLLQPETTQLKENIKADVAVIGGGMAGLMAAQSLRRHGLSVALVEAGFCGSGASGKSSGFITPDSELELSDLIANYGTDCARELWEFVSSGCEAIRKNILDHSIECDYQVQDSLFIANTPKGMDKIKHEDEARKSLHYESRFYDAPNIQDAIGSSKYYGGVRYSGTFGIVSYLYCQGLKKILQGNSVVIYENSPVTGFDNHTVHTASGSITADKIIFCADRFLPDLGIEPKDVYSGQTFLALSTPLTEQQAHDMFPGQPLMVWDTDLIYQYFRLTGERRLLLGGASLFYTYLNKEKHNSKIIINKLEKYLAEKFSRQKFDLEYLWPGLIGVSKDFLPIAGQHHQWPHVYYVGAGAGLPWSAALGSYVADKIATGRSEFDKYFATPRKYPVGYTFQALLGKPITFAISHAITKYLK